MTVNYTTLLGLAKPVSGTESGTWGDTVNTNLTDYLDSAVAGAQIISGTQTAVTLSKTTGSSLSQAGLSNTTGSSQYQIIRCTGSPLSLLTITAPTTDKTYIVINATSTSQSVKIVGVGPTSPGVTIASGKTSLVAWNGSDFVEITPATATTATTATNLASGSAGTIPYQSASGTTAMLAAGTSGQVLTSAGAAAPTWSTPAAATKTISNKTAAYTVVAGDLGKIINCTSGTFTVSLTAAASLGSGFTCTIWNANSGGSITTITIDPDASETIGGKGTWVLRNGEGVDIVCNGTNWDISYQRCNGGFSVNQIASGHNPASAAGNGAVAMGWDASAAGTNSVGIKANASSDYSVAIGSGAVMSGGYGIAIGYQASATGATGIAIGPSTVASASESVAIGRNSSYQGSQATGAGAMALGGSYASGTDSFAAAIANNTSSYGAQTQGSIAMGYIAKVSGTYRGTAIGGYGAIVSGSGGININSDDGSGWGSTASGSMAVAIGTGNKSAQFGKYTYAAGFFAAQGDRQSGKIVISASTTTTTAVELTSDQGAAGTTNQLILASGQAMAIQGTLIAKQSGSGNMAGWTITGIVSNNAGTMAVSGLALTAIGSDSITLGAQPTIAVDNTNKGVTITSGYKSATGIRWVATVNTSEVVYA